MSEEEIKGLQKHTDIIINEGLDSEDDIEGILKKWVDLYNKEKEKNEQNNKVMHKMAKLLKADSMHPMYGRNEEEVIEYFKQI